MPAHPKLDPFTKALAEAFAASSEAVTIADTKGHIIEANDVVERVYGWPRQQILGQHPLKLCPDKPYWKNLSKKIWDTVTTAGAWDGAVMNRNAKGEEIPILLRVRSILFGGKKYTFSYARPFPVGTPFNLSKQQSKVFLLLGQGREVKEIATELGEGEKANSTVDTYLRRIWEKTGRTKGSFSTNEIKRLAVRCYEAGWDAEMKINSPLTALRPKQSCFKQAK